MDPPWFYHVPLTSGVATLSDDESRHALRSLRLRPGDAVTLFDGRGAVASGTLIADEAGTRPRQSRYARVSIESVHSAPPPDETLTLIVAACKGDRLNWLVEKCTELGVTRIVITEFKRSVVHATAKHATKLQRDAIEACKQCGRAHLPEIEAGGALRDALRDVDADALLVADLDAEALPLRDVWRSNCTIVIGPEGGFDDDEHAELHGCGARTVRLARHVLRVETAAVAAAATWAGAVQKSA